LELEKVEGSFYKEELKPVNAADAENINWKIERIVGSRRVKGKPPQSLVKWFGYSNKFNTYVNTADLKK